MPKYDVPEEIKKTNLILRKANPVEVGEDTLTILSEYESIIRVQKEGILKLREDKLRRRKFDPKEKGLVLPGAARRPEGARPAGPGK